jgi:cytochrome c1
MKIHLKKYTLSTSFALLFLALSATLSLNAESSDTSGADVAQSTKGDFIRGAKLWANTCVRCHNMRDPKDLTDEEWKVATSHMKVRAGLTGQDTRDILEFLQKSN